MLTIVSVHTIEDPALLVLLRLLKNKTAGFWSKHRHRVMRCLNYYVVRNPGYLSRTSFTSFSPWQTWPLSCQVPESSPGQVSLAQPAVATRWQCHLNPIPTTLFQDTNTTSLAHSLTWRVWTLGAGSIFNSQSSTRPHFHL